VDEEQIGNEYENAVALDSYKMLIFEGYQE
jgi:hypothetical protein